MAFLLLVVLLAATAAWPSQPTFTNDATQLKSDLYLEQLRRRVEAVWKYPNQSENLQATVKFSLNRGGYVSDLLITKSSGREDFDLSVLQAVKTASPFPPIPDDLMQNSELRKVEMTFSRKPELSDSEKKSKPKPPPSRRPRRQTPGIEI
jgi:TonB family protein